MSITDLLVLHSSPTLAGLKSASLLSLNALTVKAPFPKKALEDKGLSFWTLPSPSGAILLLVYRKAGLARAVSSAEARAVLEPLGYDCSDLGSCLLKLRERSRSAGFPHEIGIFLGYPAHDVRGFIENGGKNCRFSGMWKVYGDIEGARKLLRQWTECRRIYMDAYRKGTAIEKLCITA